MRYIYSIYHKKEGRDVMEKNELLSSRAEQIKWARESCNKNLACEVYSSPREDKEGIQNENFVKKKLVMVRLLCAVILAIAIIAMDQLEVSINGVESQTIENVLDSNEVVKKMETYITNYTEEKIIPVFNRLK